MRFGFIKSIIQKVETLVTGRGRIDEELFEQLEEALLQADVNVHTTTQALDALRTAVREQRIKGVQEVRALLAASLRQTLTQGQAGALELAVAHEPPTVYLVVGVNGVGKTTSIAKLCRRLQQRGDRVLLAAADTFRAGAIEQLAIWAGRLGVDVVRHREGADPSAVVFDAIQAARSRGANIVIADTAGRLHTRANLMEELKKTFRITERTLGRKPDEVLLVLDATTGQNAISQARAFSEAVGVTGIIVAKLDGTARGGIVITIADELGLPIKLVGTGERVEDMDVFDPEAFIDALIG